MSEQILRALMQLFAIIARPEGNERDRRTVVESFLKRQLNEELSRIYLQVFDKYYNVNLTRQQETNKLEKRRSSDSVRVLVICTQINEELTQKQKVIVLIQLLEFVKSGINQMQGITEQEMAFVNTVADTFNIPPSDYNLIRSFVLYPFSRIPNSDRIVVIDNQKNNQLDKAKHMYLADLEGQIRVLHLTLTNMYMFRYIGKKEMYLNGQLLQQDKVYVLNPGSSIRDQQIRPVYYSDIIRCFNEETTRTGVVFEVKDITYKFKGGKTGLHPMSFVEESGRLIGIMGASGAGKSTLLNILNGTFQPTSGEILINGINIHSGKAQLEGLIGYVSQDDLLIEELTVFQNLYYNAKLCFGNYSEEKLTEVVNDMLQTLGLHEIREMRVGSPLNKKISGGQRKRLNIALELIREPGVLFLDEPTSGLSSRDSENILDLLKELTLKGKLVFVVIHQPSSDIFKMFDNLILLDTGGYLIYNGDPIESIMYFKSRMQHANWSESECHACGNVNPEKIFNIVESQVINEYGKTTPTRKVSPVEWNKYYLDFAGKEPPRKPETREMPGITFKAPGKLKQFLVFAQRDILSKLSNTQYLFINLLEAPVLAFLLSYIIKYYNVNITNELGYNFSENSNLPVYIFMSVIVAIFIGLSVSAEEIIKDRKILKREAFLDLSWASYLFSKIGVLFLISAIQALSFVIIGNSIMEIKGMYFSYWLVLFSAWASSNLMGLVISDSFKTVVTIYILIPFLVIPQIILSGIIVKYEKLNPSISSPGKIPVYGEIITARWAYEALSVHQYINNRYQTPLYSIEKTMSQAEFKKNYWVRNLKNKADYIERYHDQPEREVQIAAHLQLLQNEIGKELKTNPVVQLPSFHALTLEEIDPKVLASLHEYLDRLNTYYIRLYNKANETRDQIISGMQKTEEDKQAFLALKREYFNESLTDFVRNTDELERIVEYRSRLFQKIDPIYQDPEGKFIKAHFYAPTKRVAGVFYSTYWVNIGVIWFMTILLFMALYFRLFKRVLDYLEYLFEKIKGSE